jgi:hypothetical protein
VSTEHVSSAQCSKAATTKLVSAAVTAGHVPGCPVPVQP